MNTLYEAFLAHRRTPDDPIAEGDFYDAARSYLQARARGRSADPEDAAQRALVKVWHHLRAARGESPRHLRAWLRTIVDRCSWDARPKAARVFVPLDDTQVDPQPGPGTTASNRALGQSLQAAVEQSLGVELATLSSSDHAWARTRRVATRPDGRARDLRIVLALRYDGDSSTVVGSRLGMTPAAVRQAGRRGAALLALAARLAGRGGGDLLLRDGRDRIARRFGGEPPEG